MTEFWSIKVSDVVNSCILLVTIWAIIYGPYVAVKIAQKAEERREAVRRKWHILTALMRTRRIYMHPDHVGALNLVQLEFHDHPAVISTYKQYIANLEEALPQQENDIHNFLQKRRDLFFNLLHELTKVVGYRIDRHELERFAYVPTGWEAEEQEQRLFRRWMIELLGGQRALPITNKPPSNPNVFPPPP